MKDGEVHCIINLEKYAQYMRKNAATSFAQGQTLEESEDLEQYVTTNQACQMIEENSIGKNEEGLYLITDEGCQKLMEQLQTRIYNSGLSKLAAKNLLECSWDSKKNTMIFWSNEKGVND